MLVTTEAMCHKLILLVLILCSLNSYVLSQDPANGTEIWKYILKWTPLDALGERRDRLVAMNCQHQNCFVTADRNYFQSLADFDAVVFNVKYLQKSESLPQQRSPTQKYVFAAAESAQNYPVCGARFDGYFNWTWTYRLDSDVRWAYLGVRDARGRRAGPAPAARWDPSPGPVPDELRAALRTKSKAVAWFVSRRNPRSHLEKYVGQLRRELMKYNLSVDVFSRAGPRRCPGGGWAGCREMLRRDYYFCLSFEDSEDTDFVTNKLLVALRNDAVPIVYGGADYTRFLPPGAYLNAKQLSPSRLAQAIKRAVDDPATLHGYFSWRRDYSYQRTHEQGACELCARLNDQPMVRRRTVWRELVRWWSGARCPPPTTQRQPFPYLRIGSAFFQEKW